MKIDEKLEALARHHEAIAEEHRAIATSVRLTATLLNRRNTDAAKAALPARLKGAMKLREGTSKGDYGVRVQEILKAHNGGPVSKDVLRAELANVGYATPRALSGLSGLFKAKAIAKTSDGYVLGSKIMEPALPFASHDPPATTEREPEPEPANGNGHSNGNGKPKRGEYGQIVQGILRDHHGPMTRDALRDALAKAGITEKPFAGFGILTRHGHIKKTAQGHYKLGKTPVAGRSAEA